MGTYTIIDGGGTPRTVYDITIPGADIGTAMVPVSTQGIEVGAFSYTHIATAVTTNIKSGVGVLGSININTMGSSDATITIYDSNTGSGQVIAIIGTYAPTYVYHVKFTVGLTVVTEGTTPPDITVAWS